MKKIMQLDIFSTLPLIPGIVYLMLALQEGGQAYAVSYHIVTFSRTIGLSLHTYGMSPLLLF